MPGAASESADWLIYALGGGWGHLSRALALGRIAARERCVAVLTNSPYAEFAASRQSECRIIALPDCWPMERIRAEAGAIVAGFAGSRLVVDTFPRGLGGELASVLSQLKMPKVLVVRDLSPRYVGAMALREFVRQHYAVVVAPRDAYPAELSDLDGTIETEPWLLRDAPELPSRTEARALLGVDDEQQPLVVICASGTPSEAAWFGEAARLLADARQDVAVRCLAASLPPGCPPALHFAHWPAMERLPAADLVLSGGGYHLLQECRALAIPCLVRPWPRTYDRQERRSAAAAGVVREPGEAVVAVNRLLKVRSAAPAVYENGAHEAVRRIAAYGA